MNKELLNSGSGMEDAQEENNYQHYLELGGIINENDYNSAFQRAKNTSSIAEVLINQAKSIARHAGIELVNPEGTLDKRTLLYGILRSDVQPKGVKDHHSQMTDQRIFVEALRMLGDTESLDKMIKSFPHISFKYGEPAA